MHIEVEKSGCAEEIELLQATFFDQLTQHGFGWMLFAIIVSAKLQPAAELAMEVQQQLLEIGRNDKRARRDMAGQSGAVPPILMVRNQSHHIHPMPLFCYIGGLVQLQFRQQKLLLWGQRRTQISISISA